MKKYIKWIAAILAIVLLFVGSYFIYKGVKEGSPDTNTTASQQKENESTSKNESQAANDYSAPDFTVKNKIGKNKTLSDLNGKPVVICFWASWDSDCEKQLNAFEEAYKKYGQDITFMMINMTDGKRETVKTAKAFVKEHGYTFPVFYDKDFSAAESYNVNLVPTSYFISKSGELAADAKGFIDFSAIEKGISMIK